MFLINSRYPLVCAAFLGKHPFSRSYGVILPSSFNMVLSSALVYSTCSPVSVWGTVRFALEVHLPIPPSFFLEVHQPAQSSNSRVTRGLVVAKATSSLSCTHRTKPFRGFLRDRFTLRRFTERRNP